MNACWSRVWSSLRSVLAFSIVTLAFICLFSTQSSARTITTSINWSALSPVPDATENMIIKNGATVTVDVSNAVADNISMGAGGGSAGPGTLKFNAGSVLTLSGSNGTLTLGLSATNTGTVDMTLGGTVYVKGFGGSNGFLIPGAGLIEVIGTTTLHEDISTYNNLNVNVSGGTVTLFGATTISGNLNVNAGTFSANNLALSVSGNWTNNSATSAFTAGTATVTFNGASAQAIGGSFATTFNNLTVSNTGNTVTSGVNSSVVGNLLVSSGTFDLGNFTANRSTAGGTLTVSNGATLKIGGTNTLPSNYSTHSIGATSTIEYSGAAQSVVGLNSTQDYGNLIVSGSGTKTLEATENVAGNLTISAGTFDLGANTINRTTAGGTLTLSSGAALKIGGTNTFPSSYNTHSIGATSTVQYSGTTQSVIVLNSAQNYGNLTISGSGSKTLAATISVAGDLTVSAGTLDLGSFTANHVGAGGTLSVASTATLKIGGTNTFPSNYSTHSLAFVSVVEYAGTNQIVGALNSGQEYNGLTISGSGTKTLTGDLNVAGNLTLSSGTLTTGAYTIYSKATGNVFRVSGWVNGNLKRFINTGSPTRIFDVGDANNYTPVTVVFASVTTGGDLTVSVAASDHANIGTSTINAAKSVNRTWALTNSGLVFGTYGATFTFVAGDVDGSANTANFIVGKYSAGWTYPTVGNKNPTSTQATELNTFSDFQLGELAPPPTYSVSGNVFEDKNYGGGAGRSLASSSGVACPSARVELFNSSGTYQTFATTDGIGSYTFSGLAAGTYTVRVVNASVSTSRGVFVSTSTQTFRTDASSGAALAVTDHVGGEAPGLLDAVDGSTTLAALTTGIFTAQSITSVALSSGNISGVDFGYSFNVIVNKNDSGQGSLRRVLNFANAVSNTGLAQSGLTAGIDNAVFMLADGTARPGLTASYPSQFVSGVATVDLTSVLATVSDPIILDATLQPGYSGIPIIELNGAGTGAGTTGITITAGASTVRGVIINRFTLNGINLTTAGNNTIAANYIGTNALASAASANASDGILITSANNTIGGTNAAVRNVISGNTGQGIHLDGAGATGNLVQGNYIGTNAAGTGALPNSSNGVYVFNGAAGNTIGGTAAGAENLISGNSGKGVVIAAGTGNGILSNSIYGNTGIGIDLANDGFSANDGTKSGALANYGMDTPVFTRMSLIATTLSIAGYVGNAAGQSTFAGASVQMFKSDNDASGFGEGQTYLGTLTADSSGNFTGTLTVSLAIGDKVTATATDATNNTSEFAANVTVAPPPSAPPLGAAESFAVLAATTVTNTGLTVVSGNLGVSPGTAVTGFGPGVIQNGAIYSGSGSLAGPAQASAATAYNNLVAQPCLPANNLSGKVLGVDTGAVTLVPGVYCFNTSAQLTTILTLDDGGDPNAVFIFQIGTTLTTASYSQVVMSGGGRGPNVFWQIGTSATLGTFTSFRGNVIASTSITMTTGVNTTGRVFAIGAAVTMDTNNVDAMSGSSEPDVTLTANVSPNGTAPPGTDLVYTISFSNNGESPAYAFVITDPIPTNTDFKVGSVTNNLGTTGLTVTVAYSDDDKDSWTYTPVSTTGGAPAGYDRSVTHVRWSFSANLSQTSPNNSGSVGLTTRIQ